MEPKPRVPANILTILLVFVAGLFMGAVIYKYIIPPVDNCCIEFKECKEELATYKGEPTG
jgi:hypothetical protein